MSVDLQAFESEVREEQAASSSPPRPEPADGYRRLCSAAVTSFAIGVLSISAFFDWWLLAVPVIGLLIGLDALRQINRRGGELSGKPLAKAGIVLAIVLLTAGAGWQTYAYITEPPEGYLRISYDELQPDEKIPQQRIPPSARELDGKQVFIKGYMYPEEKRFGIVDFLLVRDQGDCCFGGNPKLTDRIHVRISDPQGVSFTAGTWKVAGVFRVEPDATLGVVYHLEQALVR